MFYKTRKKWAKKRIKQKLLIIVLFLPFFILGTPVRHFFNLKMIKGTTYEKQYSKLRYFKVKINAIKVRKDLNIGTPSAKFEKKVVKELEKVGFFVLENALLQLEDKTFEFDQIVITGSRVVVFENKNYHNLSFGPDGWLVAKGKARWKMTDPFSQTEAKIKYLQKFIEEKYYKNYDKLDYMVVVRKDTNIWNAKNEKLIRIDEIPELKARKKWVSDKPGPKLLKVIKSIMLTTKQDYLTHTWHVKDKRRKFDKAYETQSTRISI